LGVLYFLVLLFLKDKKSLLNLFFFAPVTMGIYLLSYIGYFLNGHNLREFLGLQKWVLVFHKSSLAFAFPGGPFWMMLFDRWESWFGGLWYRDHVIIPSPDWQISWPIVLLLTIVALSKIIKSGNFRKGYPNQARFIVTFWIFFYLLFLSFIPIFPRYLLLIIPLMYILSLDLLFSSGFLKTIFSFLKKEIKKYKTDYLYFVFLVLLLVIWKVPGIRSGNFIFSPQFAHDLSVTRNIIFRLTSLTELSLPEILKTSFLSLPYFLVDGKPQTLLLFLTFFPVGVGLVLYYIFRKKNKRLAPLLILPTIFLLLFFYQLAWDIPIFPQKGREEIIFKNEKEILDFTYWDSKIYKFAVIHLNEKSMTDHYDFLYKWYETRQYRGKNLPVGDKEMQILYVTMEPNYKINDSDKQKLAADYKLKFRFDQKFPSGVVVWKFDRLIYTKDSERLRQ